MEHKRPGPPGIVVTAIVLVALGWVDFTFGAIYPDVWRAERKIESSSGSVAYRRTFVGYWYRCVDTSTPGQNGCSSDFDTTCDDLNERLDAGKAAGIIAILLTATYLVFIIVDCCCRCVLVSWLGGLISLLAFLFTIITWALSAGIYNEELCGAKLKDEPGAALGMSFYNTVFGSLLIGAGVLMHWIHRSFCENDRCCDEGCPCTCCCPEYFHGSAKGSANEPTRA